MIHYLSFLIAFFLMAGTGNEQPSKKKPKIVFIMGDEEYRSEESMPMLAQILHRNLGAEIALCYSVNSEGIIDPSRLDHIEGLEALVDADLMVVFTRFRALPDKELNCILDYVNSGRPVVGFRTATHAFLYKDYPTKSYLNNDWTTQIFGQQWITHHGHFDDGNGKLTAVSLLPKVKSPILNGVQPFEAYSWLYHVDGGKWKLHGDAMPLLEGKALRSNHQNAGKLNEYPLTNPVAWTKTYQREQGKIGRVFFTTLGHPFDFKIESMRKLAINGIYWALGLESKIPKKGANVDFVNTYEPNNSGMGLKYKPYQKPIHIP